MDNTENNKLTPADQNPWYCLATLYGEYLGNFDPVLQKRNREAWNKWASISLDLGTRKRLKKEHSYKDFELAAPEGDQLREIIQNFYHRIGNDKTKLPDFSHPIDISNIVTGNIMSFSRYIFPSHCDFSYSAFYNGAKFEGAVFLESVSFFYTKFSHHISFYRTTFEEQAIFEGARFPTADFEKAVFSSSSDFKDATFDRGLFAHTIFTGTAGFKRAKFSELATFSGATIAGGATYHSATFSGSSLFMNTQFRTPTVFSDASFEFEPPQFFGASLHEGTSWLDVKWPPPPEEREQADLFVRTYERLKLEMARLNKIEDELDFLARELECKAIRDGGGKAALIRAYGLLSGFGRSTLRPIFWLFLVWCAGLTSLFSGCLSVGQAIAASTSNLVAFFGFSRAYLNPDMIQMLPGWVKLLFAGQTVLAAPLLFLLLLAIRNRFRIK